MADCRLLSSGEEVLVHAPSLELGGLCVPGVKLLLSPAGAYSKKTTFAIQLLATPDNESGETTWIGANPVLGNRLVAAALAQGLLVPVLGSHSKLRAEVQPPGSLSRFDFVLEHGGGVSPSSTFLEAKSVVCSDWPLGALTPNPQPSGYSHVFSAHRAGQYERAAIFPVGRKGQKLGDGTAVVSERAIKHVRELAALCSPRHAAALCFVVNRGDCRTLSLTRSSCPAFAPEVKELPRRASRCLPFECAGWKPAKHSGTACYPVMCSSHGI
jgi:DNA-binding sugar fermentation-stimulating protein